MHWWTYRQEKAQIWLVYRTRFHSTQHQTSRANRNMVSYQKVDPSKSIHSILCRGRTRHFWSRILLYPQKAVESSSFKQWQWRAWRQIVHCRRFRRSGGEKIGTSRVVVMLARGTSRPSRTRPALPHRPSSKRPISRTLMPSGCRTSWIKSTIEGYLTRSSTVIAWQPQLSESTYKSSRAKNLQTMTRRQSSLIT